MVQQFQSLKNGQEENKTDHNSLTMEGGKKIKDPVTMVEEGEHPNTKKPMNTQELLNTMVAGQIQLKEDMNLMVQQFQNLKSGQEENKTNHNSLTMEGEKKINERINKVEEMIRRARKMDDLMDY